MYRFIASVWETGFRLNRFGLDTDLEGDNVTFKVPISILKVGPTAPEGLRKCPNSLDSNFVLSLIWDWKIASHHRFSNSHLMFFQITTFCWIFVLWRCLCMVFFGGWGGVHQLTLGPARLSITSPQSSFQHGTPGNKKDLLFTPRCTIHFFGTFSEVNEERL